MNKTSEKVSFTSEFNWRLLASVSPDGAETSSVVRIEGGEVEEEGRSSIFSFKLPMIRLNSDEVVSIGESEGVVNVVLELFNRLVGDNSSLNTISVPGGGALASTVVPKEREPGSIVVANDRELRSIVVPKERELGSIVVPKEREPGSIVVPKERGLESRVVACSPE